MTFYLDGPAGPLEARYDPAPEAGGAQAVLCHPHPQYGGSLDDAVLDVAAGRLLDAGIGVLRFNFRGVGGSAGAYDAGTGEVADVLAAAAWLRGEHPAATLWAGGYSFGAWVVWRALSAGLGADRVLLIAPPAGPMDFTAEAPPLPSHTPVQVIAGSDDAFIDPTALGRLPGVTTTLIAGADHFFSGRQAALADAVADALRPAALRQSTDEPSRR